MQDALVIGSRLDADPAAAACRLAFYGRLAGVLGSADAAVLSTLRVFKRKQRVGSVERTSTGGGGGGGSCICRGLFKKETDISIFTGMKVRFHFQGNKSISGMGAPDSACSYNRS